MAKKTFEAALKQLEEIVREMESGDLSLEQAVKRYEAGITHSKYCLDILDQTEKKITQLTIGTEGSMKEEAFDNE